MNQPATAAHLAKTAEAPAYVKHARLKTWVAEIAALTKPDRVHWCDGSEEEKRRLTTEALVRRELISLDAAKHPGSVLHRSAPNDTAYTETYYQFQMDVYSLLLERNGYPISRTAYVVYYYPLEGSLHDGFPFGVAIHEVSTDPDAAYHVFQAAHRLLAGPMPSSAETCEFCRWLAARNAAA